MELAHKNLTKNQSTILGHLQQPRKGLRSTQGKVMHPETDTEHDHLPQATQSENTNLFFFKTIDLSGNFFTDQTGRFPVTSSKGNKYILVAYHYDSNTIHDEPLKTRSGLDLTEQQSNKADNTIKKPRPILSCLTASASRFYTTYPADAPSSDFPPSPAASAARHLISSSAAASSDAFFAFLFR